MTRRILTGVGSLLLMAAILIGLPAALIAVHNVGAIHLELTSSGIWAALMRPDDGTLALFLIKVAGWIVWAICLSLVAVEAISRLRHVKVPHLRGLDVPQALTRSIVTSAVALFISAGGITAPQHNPPSPAEISATDHSPTDSRLLAAPTTEPGARSYTVKKGDTLSEIALDKLGNGHRYPAIFKASKVIRQPGGVHLTDPDMIDIGWTLNIPPRHKPKAPDEPRTDDRRSTSTRPPKVDQPTPRTGQATPPPATTRPPDVSANPTASTPPEAHESDADYQPGWLLTGLTGAGAVLAGSLWLLLRRRREIQYRHRRPGRTIHNAPREVVPVEKTLIREGEPIANTILFIDETLRRLAATLVTAGAELPDVVAAELGVDRLRLHLSHPAAPPRPWRADGENMTWTITNTGDPDEIGPLEPDSPPPWPQLVTVGEADDGHAWLLNFEHYGTTSITGDADFTADLALYIAGELATNPWSRDVTLHLLNTCGEVSGINTDRTRFYTDPKVVDTLIAEAVETVDRVNATHTTSLATSRFKWTGEELWDSRALIAPTEADGHVAELVKLISQLPGRTATSLILVGGADPQPAKLELRTTPEGRVVVPELRLNLVVNGLTTEEALGCAQLIQAADALEDEPVPTPEQPEQAWQQWSDSAGLIKASVATERGEPDPDAVSVLPATDEEIVAVTASTVEELQRIAPAIPAPVAAQVLASDPMLDTDLAEWFAESSERPRLTVLGPVKLRVGRGGQPVESARRRPYYTEIVAY
ncbi:MAG TPA: LysM peptidoglycan-binding domain-containing protein, partial [Propionicimonas sp.]